MGRWIVPFLGTLVLITGAAGGCAGLRSDDRAGAVAAVAPPQAALTVISIVDGDTVDLSDGRRVRLLGIDTPEQGECGFEQVSEFGRSTLLHRPVTVATNPTRTPSTPTAGRCSISAPTGWTTRWQLPRPDGQSTTCSASRYKRPPKLRPPRPALSSNAWDFGVLPAVRPRSHRSRRRPASTLNRPAQTKRPCPNRRLLHPPHGCLTGRPSRPRNAIPAISHVFRTGPDLDCPTSDTL